MYANYMEKDEIVTTDTNKTPLENVNNEAQYQ